MQPKNVNDINPEDTGLAFEKWESQRTNGEVDKALQKEKAIETTRYYSNLYTNAVRAKKEERDTAKASFDAYIGIGGRQWDPKALETLNKQNRPVNTFNVIKPNIDKVYGQLVLNPNTINFTPMNQSAANKTNIVQSLYEYDFERGGWQKEKNKFTKDVLIHTGILEMYKDYRHNSLLGNVGIKSLNRYLDIVFDPYWTTDDMNDCEYVFKSTWKTGRQIKMEYSTKSEEIDRSIKAFEMRDGVAFDAESIETLADRDSEFYDSTRDRYRVIEVIYMQKIPKTAKYSKKLDRYLEENENPDLMRGNNDTIIDLPVEERICKVMTMIPGVQHGLILQEGDHPIQIGRLPYFVASTDFTMAERQGAVTGVIDAQVVLNKRQSMITAGQITSSNGGLIVKQGFFKDANEHERFVRDRNVPGKVFTADDNAKLSDGIINVPQGQEPQGLQESVQWAEQYIEKSMNNVDAVSGRSGGANESGVLFESKKSQAQVAHVNLVETLAQIDKEIAEAYFFACKKVYSGPRRSFTNAKTGDQFEINKRVPVVNQDPSSVPNATVNGFLTGYTTINEIETLPRHDVVIKRSELGLDQKQRSLSIYNEMMQRSANPIMKALYEKAMVPLMDVPEEMVEPMQNAADIFMELQLAQTKNNIQLLNDGMTQSQINTKMLEAQAGGAMQQQVAPDGAQDARSVANGDGQGNLPEALAQDSTGANNQSASDV